MYIFKKYRLDVYICIYLYICMCNDCTYSFLYIDVVIYIYMYIYIYMDWWYITCLMDHKRAPRVGQNVHNNLNATFHSHGGTRVLIRWRVFVYETSQREMNDEHGYSPFQDTSTCDVASMGMNMFFQPHLFTSLFLRFFTSFKFIA